MAATLMTFMVVFSSLLMLFCWFKGDWFLWLLGAKYAKLRYELLLVLGGTAISSLSASVWGLNIARGWLKMAWLNIPLTLVAQTAAACLISLDSVQGVAWFVIVTAVMQCVHSLTTCLVHLCCQRRESHCG